VPRCYIKQKTTSRPNVVIMSEKNNTKRKWRLCADSLTFFNERHHIPFLLLGTTLFLAIQHTLDFQWAISSTDLVFVIKNTYNSTGRVMEVIIVLDFTVPKFSLPVPLSPTPDYMVECLYTKEEKKSLHSAKV